MTKYAHVQGFVESGFGKVAEAFEHNFTEHGELGAGFALYAGGRQVVDIWGGIADKASGRAWDIDTLHWSSTTKGATAICMPNWWVRTITHERCSALARVRPEGRKASGRRALSQQAGLIALRPPLSSTR